MTILAGAFCFHHTIWFTYVVLFCWKPQNKWISNVAVVRWHSRGINLPFYRCKVCGHAPDLTHLVHSTPLPLRPKDSPLALRKLSTHRPSLGAPLGANPNTNPRSSPNSSPMPTRRSMGASVPSLPMIAWSVESVQSSSEECLVTPKKKSSRDIVKSIFKRGTYITGLIFTQLKSVSRFSIFFPDLFSPDFSQKGGML